MNPDNKTLNETDLNEVIDKGIRKTNIILDATMLTSIMTCGRLSDFRFNLNLQSIGGKSNSLESGSIVHKFLEVYYGTLAQGMKKEDAFGFGMTAAQLYIQGCPHCTNFISTQCDNCGGMGTTTHDILIGGTEHDTEERDCIKCNGKGVTRPTCGHQPNDYPGVENTPPENEKNRIGWKWVLETCEQYYEHYRNEHWVPLEVEVVKSKILYEDDEIRILWKAKLDLITDTNQGIFPVDHKTMKQRRDTLSLNNQFIGQCLIMDTRNVFINKIGFQTSLKPAEKFERALVSYSASRLMEWQSEILPYWSRVLLMYAESGYYPPNYSNCEGKYGKCPFFDVCSSDPGMREDELKRLFKVGPVWDPTNPED